MPNISTVFLKEKEYHKGYRTDILELIPSIYLKNHTVLEIGGGDGSFRLNFADDTEYWLVEPYSEVAELANVTKVLIGTWEQVYESLPNNYFDLIVCNDVIEHMPNWRLFLIQVQEKLKRENSYLVGSIPNVRCFTNLYNIFFRKDWEYTKSGILDVTHCAFFTLKSLKRELEKANFELDSIRLMKRFEYTPSQSRIKYFLTLLLIVYFGSDSRYGQLGFRCTLKHRPNDGEIER